MRELFQILFYWLDLGIGYGFPVLMLLFLRKGREAAFYRRLFWLGAAVGLTWEIPIFVLSAGAGTGPVIQYINDPPVHWGIMMVSHTLWDGLIFLAGAWIVRLLLPGPVFKRFRLAELSLLLVWGQVTAAAVEISSLAACAWMFVPTYSWNPVFFEIFGRGLTVLPQLIWLAAPVVFYFPALKLASGRNLTS